MLHPSGRTLGLGFAYLRNLAKVCISYVEQEEPLPNGKVPERVAGILVACYCVLFSE